MEDTASSRGAVRASRQCRSSCSACSAPQRFVHGACAVANPTAASISTSTSIFTSLLPALYTASLSLFASTASAGIPHSISLSSAALATAPASSSSSSASSPNCAPASSRTSAQNIYSPGTIQAAKGHSTGARYLSEDDDTKIVRIALRWIFVRQQASSLGFFWADVTRSFEKAIGRKFATGKRKMGSLEEQWRAKLAARDAESGLQGNNDLDLARATWSWIAFRDYEELAKRGYEGFGCEHGEAVCA